MQYYMRSEKGEREIGRKKRERRKKERGEQIKLMCSMQWFNAIRITHNSMGINLLFRFLFLSFSYSSFSSFLSFSFLLFPSFVFCFNERGKWVTNNHDTQSEEGNSMEGRKNRKIKWGRKRSQLVTRVGRLQNWCSNVNVARKERNQILLEKNISFQQKCWSFSRGRVFERKRSSDNCIN